jgi:hypothetical protein
MLSKILIGIGLIAVMIGFAMLDSDVFYAQIMILTLIGFFCIFLGFFFLD